MIYTIYNARFRHFHVHNITFYRFLLEYQLLIFYYCNTMIKKVPLGRFFISIYLFNCDDNSHTLIQLMVLVYHVPITLFSSP